jgi:hypothetical protein
MLISALQKDLNLKKCPKRCDLKHKLDYDKE